MNEHEMVILRQFRNPFGEITLFKYIDGNCCPYSISVDCPKLDISKWINHEYKGKAIEDFQFYINWLENQYKTMVHSLDYQ